jgi:hypothetical protein
VPTKSYVEELENRVEELQTLLQKIAPGLDLSTDPSNLDVPKMINKPTLVDCAAGIIRRSMQNMDTDPGPEEDALLMLDMNTPSRSHQARFFGKSSNFMFIKEVMDLKSRNSVPIPSLVGPEVIRARRPEFWDRQNWERELRREPVKPTFEFPPDDLLSSLIDLYFEYVHIFSPLLHRPTFEENVRAGLHLENEAFASVVLMVCATGSRFSEDPRVLREPTNESYSGGFKYFNQVHLINNTVVSPATLFQLQAYCLALEFMRGAAQSSWTMVGIAIRLAQDVGAHRWKTFGRQPKSIEQELWKRVWWVLVSIDRESSAASGRPCITQDEEYDIGLPTECDDEYWEHPDPQKAWKQPKGIPSKVSFFIAHLKQSQILAHILSLLYCTQKPKHLYGVEPGEWESSIVLEFDSALNKWVDSIPAHLRWDPHQSNIEWRRQSIVLYAHYHFLQICIHRPFIPTPNKSTRLSYPSLAICTNAARACCHLLDVDTEKHLPVVYRIQWCLFSSAVVLALSVWGGRRAGLEPLKSKEMPDVYKCMELIKSNEKRFRISGKLWDVLYELTSASDLPLPVSLAPSKKRARTSEQPCSSEGGTPPVEPSRPISAEAFTVPRINESSRTIPRNQSSSIIPPPVGHTVDTIQPFSYDWNFAVPSAFDFNTSLSPHPSSTHHNSLTSNPHEYGLSPQSSIGYSSDSSLLTPYSNLSYSSGHSTAEFDTYHQDGLAQPPFYGTLADWQQHQHQHQEHQQMTTEQQAMDADTIQLWMTAPLGLEFNDWGTYLSNVSEIQMSSTLDQLNVRDS